MSVNGDGDEVKRLAYLEGTARSPGGPGQETERALGAGGWAGIQTHSSLLEKGLHLGYPLTLSSPCSSPSLNIWRFRDVIQSETSCSQQAGGPLQLLALHP